MTDGFITRLFDTKPAGLHICVWTGWDSRSHWTRSAEDADGYALMRATHADVYVGMGLHTEGRGVKERGKASQVAAIAGLWADIDVSHPLHKKANLPPDRTAALAEIERLPLRYSLLVDSGHGFQVYWLLPTVWVFATPAERQRAATLVAGWQALIKSRFATRGWDVDATHDLARILRVAGTRNHKDKTDVRPVDLIEDTGLTVTAEEVEVHTKAFGGASFAARLTGESYSVAGGGAQPASGQRFSTGTTAPSPLILAADATPPYDKDKVLEANEPKYRRTKERKRPDLTDQSPSAYDYALASITIRNGWTDQEAANLLIATRRLHGDDLKLTGDYYVRTLFNARASIRADVAAEALAQGRSSEEDARSGTTQDQEPRDERADVLADISAFLHVDVERFLQHGVEQAHYSLVLAGGREVHIGQYRDVLSADAVRGRLMDGAGVMMPDVKKRRWLEMVGQLLKVRDLVENRESTRAQTVLDWLQMYAGQGLQTVTDTVDLGEIIISNLPFVRAGELWIHAGQLRKFVITSFYGDPDMQDLRDMLRGVGFEHKHFAARYEGVLISRSYWHASRAVLDKGETENIA